MDLLIFESPDAWWAGQTGYLQHCNIIFRALLEKWLPNTSRHFMLHLSAHLTQPRELEEFGQEFTATVAAVADSDNGNRGSKVHRRLLG